MGSYRGIAGRDPELAVLSAAVTGAAAGRGSVVLVEGAPGIGKTTLLRAACAGCREPGWQALTARGLALEGGFSYGIVRQLIEPVRAAAGPGEWDGLLDGAAAHAVLGHPAEAAFLAGEQLTLARKAGTAATLGAALRCYAATAATPDAGSALAEAVNLLETTPARYELALALAGLGAHLRRTGRPGEARAPLRRALDLAQRSGAAPLADQARQELLATGARPRRTALTGPDALTGAERRVADLAAGGMSNRQIAQHLFITLPTVETHLRHAFHKLGVTSRAGLPAQLASQARPASLPDEPAQAVTAASRA